MILINITCGTGGGTGGGAGGGTGGEVESSMSPIKKKLQLNTCFRSIQAMFTRVKVDRT